MTERLEKLSKLFAGAALGNYRLSFIEREQPFPGGWKAFQVFLSIPDSGGSYEAPLLDGVFQGSARTGSGPVMEAAYHPILTISSGEGSLDFSSTGEEEALFKLVGEAIEPGECILFSCEGEREIHSLTREALQLGVSPFFTPLGRLLEAGGFEWIEVWASQRAGQERGKRLWCEKPLQDGMGQARRERLAVHFLDFLDHPCRRGLSPLVENARKEVKARLKAMAVKDAALKERIERIE